MAKKTPLYENHLQCNGKMVDFHGWMLALNYGSQINEHHSVRQNAGMFDVSHMTIVDIIGAGGRQFLRHLLTNDIDSLQHPGRALYSCMCNEHGGIIDDLIVYQRSADNYRMVLNAATRDKDIDWIRNKCEGFSIGLQERTDLAMIAVQGPEAINLTLQTLNASQADAVSTLTEFECVDVGDWFFARTGYTGEDGLEIILPITEVAQFWENLRAKGITPCGLGARDTLRLEAGLMLYGQDMDESTTPFEAGLGWTIKWDPQERDFIGKGALLSEKREGVKKKTVGLILKDKGVMRSGHEIIINDKVQGMITSGSYSPTLEQSIAIARVSKEVGDEVLVDIRGKKVTALVRKPRFVKKGQILD